MREVKVDAWSDLSEKDWGRLVTSQMTKVETGASRVRIHGAKRHFLGKTASTSSDLKSIVQLLEYYAMKESRPRLRYKSQFTVEQRWVWQTMHIIHNGEISTLGRKLFLRGLSFTNAHYGDSRI